MAITKDQAKIRDAIIDDLEPMIHKRKTNQDISMYLPFVEAYTGFDILELELRDGPYNGKYKQLAAIPKKQFTSSIAIPYKDLARFIATGEHKQSKKSDKKKIIDACRHSLYDAQHLSDLYKKFPPKKGYEVDHCGKYEFTDIVDIFIERALEHNEQWTVDYLALKVKKRLSGLQFFTDYKIKPFFIKVHDEIAELQYLTIEEHREKTKNKIH